MKKLAASLSMQRPGIRDEIAMYGSCTSVNRLLVRATSKIVTIVVAGDWRHRNVVGW
jgi:hypothetical protein